MAILHSFSAQAVVLQQPRRKWVHCVSHHCLLQLVLVPLGTESAWSKQGREPHSSDLAPLPSRSRASWVSAGEGTVSPLPFTQLCFPPGASLGPCWLCSWQGMETSPSDIVFTLLRHGCFCSWWGMQPGPSNTFSSPSQTQLTLLLVGSRAGYQPHSLPPAQTWMALLLMGNGARSK